MTVFVGKDITVFVKRGKTDKHCVFGNLPRATNSRMPTEFHFSVLLFSIRAVNVRFSFISSETVVSVKKDMLLRCFTLNKNLLGSGSCFSDESVLHDGIVAQKQYIIKSRVSSSDYRNIFSFENCRRTVRNSWRRDPQALFSAAIWRFQRRAPQV